MVCNLSLQVFRLTFKAQKNGIFTEFPGFIWRGSLGNRLWSMHCETGMPNCKGCEIAENCGYHVLFESRPLAPKNDGLLNAYAHTPHPFVLIPEHSWSVKEHDMIRLGLVVIGTAQAYTLDVLKALLQCATHGVGRPPVKSRLIQVEQEFPPGSDVWHSLCEETIAPDLQVHEAQTIPVPCVPNQAHIMLLTPLRLRVKETYLGKNKPFVFSPFFNTLSRRISQLSAYYGTMDNAEVDYRALAECAHKVRYQCEDIAWHDWQRRSSRQGSYIPMGGITGLIHVQGNLESLWPWLWLGQWLHVGKGAVMGLGCYRILTN